MIENVHASDYVHGSSMGKDIDTGEEVLLTNSCYDCLHLKAAVSWWCTNKSAIKYRGTQIPGVRNCDFWSPCKLVQKKKTTKKVLRQSINKLFQWIISQVMKRG